MNAPDDDKFTFHTPWPQYFGVFFIALFWVVVMEDPPAPGQVVLATTLITVMLIDYAIAAWKRNQ